MKGIILAGGTGSRLLPNTKVTNKHLLPVFNKPMILYPIDTLRKSGIREILIISDIQNISAFMRFLGSGNEFGVDFTYKIQEGAGGIAEALSLAADFANNEPIALILGDNIFEDDFAENILNFKIGARVFIKKVEDASRFGVVELDQDGIVKSIEEKPVLPKSNFAVAGFYLFDNKVFDFIKKIKPSERGELEITDVINIYLQNNKISVSKITGLWIDAGTHESLLEANILAQEAFDPERVKLRLKNKPTKAQIDTVAEKVDIGLITYNSEKYIIPCLTSLINQTYDNISITIHDNGSSDDTVKIIRENFKEVSIIVGEKNIGFGRANNEIIKQTTGDYIACLNIDAIFEPNFIAELVSAIRQKPIYGAAGGKIKQWDFSAYTTGDSSQGKTNFIDTVAIEIYKNHQFKDKGQGEVDYGQYDSLQKIFGVSGAAVLYRRKSLQDVAFTNSKGETEYFDEEMFMYKEDVDMAYRLQWGGWSATFNASAVAYHDRSISTNELQGFIGTIKNRLKKSTLINRESYKNHHLLIRKNFAKNYSLKVRFSTFIYNTKVFLYILLFETELLTTWWQLWKNRKRIKKWQKNMPKRVPKNKIEDFMKN